MKKREIFEKALMKLPKIEQDALLHKLMKAKIEYDKLSLFSRLKIKFQLQFFKKSKN